MIPGKFGCTRLKEENFTYSMRGRLHCGHIYTTLLMFMARFNTARAQDVHKSQEHSPRDESVWCFVKHAWSAALQAYPRHRVLKHNACVMRRVEKSQGSRLAHIVLLGSAPCLGWSTSAMMVHRVPISIESEKSFFLVKNNVERRQLMWKTFIRLTPRP